MLSFGTQNMNGSLTGNSWKNLLKEARRRAIDVLLIQEHNLREGDSKRMESMRETAKAFGYKNCRIARIPKNNVEKIVRCTCHDP